MSERGEVVAIVASFGDAGLTTDARMLDVGAVEGEYRVAISGYRHALLQARSPDAVAAGFGVVRAEGTHLIFRGRFVLSMPGGRWAYELARQSGGRLGWSFAYRRPDGAPTWRREIRDGQVVHVDESVLPFEVSPTFRPADRTTCTLMLDGKPVDRLSRSRFK